MAPTGGLRAWKICTHHAPTKKGQGQACLAPQQLRSASSRDLHPLTTANASRCGGKKRRRVIVSVTNATPLAARTVPLARPISGVRGCRCGVLPRLSPLAPSDRAPVGPGVRDRDRAPVAGQHVSASPKGRTRVLLSTWVLANEIVTADTPRGRPARSLAPPLQGHSQRPREATCGAAGAS
jgi:hypothetical protein